MDSGGGIRIGSSVRTRQQVGVVGAVQVLESQRRLRWLAQRLSVRGWIVAAAVSLGVCLMAAIGSVALSGILVTLALVALAGAGLIGGVAALAMAGQARRMQMNAYVDRSRLLDERRRQMSALLETTSDGVSVAQAVSRLGWLEDAVVTTLKAMVDENEVIEDLDVESGAWVYRLSTPRLLAYESAELDVEHLTIAERAATVEAARRS